MSPTFAIALLFPALTSCTGRQPALLLQCTLLTRAQATTDTRQHRHELTFSASVALPFEQTILEQPRTDDPEPAPLTPDCEPNSAPLCAWAQLAEQLAWTQARLLETSR